MQCQGGAGQGAPAKGNASQGCATATWRSQFSNAGRSAHTLPVGFHSCKSSFHHREPAVSCLLGCIVCFHESLNGAGDATEASPLIAARARASAAHAKVLRLLHASNET